MSLLHHLLFQKEEARLDVVKGHFTKMNPCRVQKLFLQPFQITFHFNRRENEECKWRSCPQPRLTAQHTWDVIYF